MNNNIRHRGPDDEGVVCIESLRLGLGHLRLSIVDLSPLGHQPMVSPSGRFHLVFNGEIYNHRALRNEVRLRDPQWVFRGESDTETMLAMIEVFGLEESLQKFAGMFAFALADVRERRLHLVRDRLGKKPLYYGHLGREFAFASELDAIARLPNFDGTLCEEAVDDLLRLTYIAWPKTIYRSTKMVPPGGCLTFRIEEHSIRLEREHRFWSHVDLKRIASSRQELSDAQAESQLDGILRTAVRERMMADVPLGAFLSGGVDSSLIVALMQQETSSRVRTFSIANEDRAWDESQAARAVAVHLKTEHTELLAGAKEALEVALQLPQIFDEPLADSSQIPSYLVAKLARPYVTVALTGDGGDEVFGGYNRHALAARQLPRMFRVPAWIRNPASVALEHLPIATLARAYDAIPGLPSIRLPGMKMKKLGKALGASSWADLYQRLITHGDARFSRYGGKRETADAAMGADLDPVECFMLADTFGYLPGDILTKVDRATMAVALEARSPFLDHRVVEFAWSLPTSMKVRDGSGKWLLRQMLAKHVPTALTDRPKMGFGVPVGDWLRGPLREFGESHLSEDSLRNFPMLDAPNIRAAWKSHQQNPTESIDGLWAVLMFTAWADARKGIVRAA